MVNWDTQNRGQNRAEEGSYYDRTDYDGMSCAEFGSELMRGIVDVEDPHVRHDDENHND